MNITKISYSKGMTLNMGNYESARFDYGLEAVLVVGEDVVIATAAIKNKVDGIFIKITYDLED